MTPQWAGLLVGWASSIFLAIWLAGRWTKGIESSSASKIELLGVEIKHISEMITSQIKDLKDSLGIQYADMTHRVNEDHSRLREVLDWKAAAEVKLGVLAARVDELRVSRRGTDGP